MGEIADRVNRARLPLAAAPARRPRARAATLGQAALVAEIDLLRSRIGQAEEILRAIRRGDVDAADVIGPDRAPVRSFVGTESAFHVLVEGMAEGAAIVSARGGILYANGALAEILGADPGVVLGARLRRFVAPPERHLLDALLAGGRRASGLAELTCLRRDGSSVQVRFSASPIEVLGERAACVIATDMTDRYRMEEELRSLSLTDPLTGLLNSRGFHALAEQQLLLAPRVEDPLFLLFADLDGLKRINDQFGHLEGDRALLDTAAILRRTFRASDIVARVGGDEFVVLAISSDDADAAVLLRRLAAEVDAHTATAERPYRLSISVGVATHDPGAPRSLVELLDAADRAMYEQKQARHHGVGIPVMAPAQLDPTLRVRKRPLGAGPLTH